MDICWGRRALWGDQTHSSAKPYSGPRGDKQLAPTLVRRVDKTHSVPIAPDLKLCMNKDSLKLLFYGVFPVSASFSRRLYKAVSKCYAAC